MSFIPVLSEGGVQQTLRCQINKMNLLWWFHAPWWRGGAWTKALTVKTWRAQSFSHDLLKKALGSSFIQPLWQQWLPLLRVWGHSSECCRQHESVISVVMSPSFSQGWSLERSSWEVMLIWIQVCLEDKPGHLVHCQYRFSVLDLWV